MTNKNTTKRIERMQKALRENLLKRKKQQRERKEEAPQPQLEEATPVTTQHHTHTVLFLALMGLATLALAACGKKGNPEPLEPDTFPRTYPKG